MTPLPIDTVTTLAQFAFDLRSFFMILFVVVSVIMILIVLIQRPQGGGLSGAFGASADGAGQTAFGAKTGDALTLATVTTFILFLGTAIALNFSLRPEEVTIEEIAAQTTGVEDTGADDTPVDDLGTTFGGDGGSTPPSVLTPLETDADGRPILPEGVTPTPLPVQPSAPQGASDETTDTPAAPPADSPSDG